MRQVCAISSLIMCLWCQWKLLFRGHSYWQRHTIASHRLVYGRNIHWRFNSTDVEVRTSTSNSLLWRHNDHDGISMHQPYDCLLNRLFGRRWQKTSKLCVTGLCLGNSPGTGEHPAQRASNAEMFPFCDVIMYNPAKTMAYDYSSVFLSDKLS